jgi:hypothetical protein
MIIHETDKHHLFQVLFIMSHLITILTLKKNLFFILTYFRLILDKMNFAGIVLL